MKKIFMVIVIASILGFITENLWLAVRFGYIDNRGMAFPGLLGYGLAIVGIYFILGLPQNPVFLGRKLEFSGSTAASFYYFVATAVLVSVGEIVLGTLVEKHCHIVWWNYTGIPLHIGKYTSIPTSIGFAALISILMEHVFPRILERVARIQSPALENVSVIFLVLLVMDFVYEARYMITNKRINKLWHIDLNTCHLGGRVLIHEADMEK